MFCHNCGQELVAVAAYCGQCGSPIVESSSANSEAARSGAPASEAVHTTETDSTTKPKVAAREISKTQITRYTPWGWYIKALKNYAVFKGRATRSEFWYFQLTYLVVALLSFVIAFAVGLVAALTGANANDAQTALETTSDGLYSLYVLAVLVPALAVTVRRLHDTGKSGWWLLIALIPVIGNLVLLVFLCIDSELGTNKYGSNQKAPQELTLIEKPV